MNDLQLGPKNYPKDYDPKTLEVGDLIQYCSYAPGGVIYEVMYFDVPAASAEDQIGVNIRETCRPREMFRNEDPRVFNFRERTSSFNKMFNLKIKNKDKILKSNLCKVIAAKFFIEKELHELLIELEI